MLEGVADVDWAELGAAEVPDLLRAIPDAATALDAWWELDDLLSSRSFVAAEQTASLAAAVLPFLSELAADPEVTVRDHLLGALPALSDAAVDDSGRPDPGWERAWSEQVPRLLALRDDPDIRVRRLRLLALAVTQAPSDVARVVAELREDWHREPDDLTRIDLAHTISRLAGFEAAYHIRAWLIGLLDQGDPETRLGAAAVLATHDPPPLRAQEVLADAVRAGDVPHWEQTNWLADPNRSVADWITGAPGRLGRRIDRCLERLDDADDETRARAVRDAALVIATWRSPEEVLLPAIAARLGDGSGEARAYAIHVIAACGPASAPYADQVAELVGDESPASPHADETIGDLAVWALARIGDHRCVDELREQVRGARPGFSVWSSAGGHPQFYMLDMPAMHQVLGPLREYAPELLPAVRQRLRTTDDYQWHRELAQTLQAWEADGAEAVPELIDVLATDAAGWAAYALGSMGPAASEALPALRRLARGPGWKDRVSSRLADQARGRLELPGADRRPAFDAGNRMQAAWACARVADDLDLAGRVLAAGLDSGSARPAIRLLAGLGSLRQVDAPDELADRVRQLVDDGDDWDRIDAAQVHWRLTGDPSLAVQRMAETLRPLELACFAAPMRLAIGYADELGPPAAGTAPALEALLGLDRRLGQTGSWQSIDEDRTIRCRAQAALASVTGRPATTPAPPSSSAPA